VNTALVPGGTFDTVKNELQFSEALPLTLVSLLERRYLLNFRADSWQISSREGDHARPLLREVVGIGRPQQPGQWARVMPNVLAACHDPGHSLLMLLHGSGDRHRLYLGCRRTIGMGARSTEDHLLSQEGAFKAHFAGLRLGPIAKLDTEELPELASLLQTAPALAAMTGIPSRRGVPQLLESQSLDHFVKAIGDQRYVLMVIAEPLEPGIIDNTLDACRRLKGEVHAYIRRTISRSKGGSESKSRSEDTKTDDWTSQLPYLLYGLAAFSHLALGPWGAVAQGVAGGLQSAGMLSFYRGNEQSRKNSQQITTGQNWSESGGVELLDANAEFCEQLLQRHIDRLQSAKSGGWWRTAIYVAAESDSTLHSVTGAFRSLCNGDATFLDPIRTVALPEFQIRESIECGRILHLIPSPLDQLRAADQRQPQGHPLGESFDALATCLNSEELSVIVNLPQQEIPGLPMRDQSDFALSVPPQEADSVHVGTLVDSIGRNLGPVTVTSASLNRHVFVTGITGSGKTNTCMQLLLEAYDKFGTPFLVIEPAKAEYRHLAQIEKLKGKLRTFTVGGGAIFPFRMNPLAPIRGIPLGRHIDLLKAVFNASFPMFAGMPYVLEEALIEVYTERGWSLHSSTNAYLRDRASVDERSALTPGLQDLHDKIEVILERKNYGQEIHRNMGAALRSRLRSLMVGNKGMTLNTRRSTPLEDIFNSPSIIELQNLGDDEEKAFVMALLFILLYEYAEVRQRDVPLSSRGKLQHLTLIEEAHRLLQAVRGPAAADVGDPRAKAVSMFTDMLAEMRAYGEGFIIADQIPTKLAPETLKNSNLKIVHRLVAPDDRQIAGDCINLTDLQKRYLNNLSPGLAVIHDERIGEAVLVRVNLVKDADVTETAAPFIPSGVSENTKDKIYLYRHAGCQSCPSPCDFYHLLEETGNQDVTTQMLRPVMEYLLIGEREQAWLAFSKWRSQWRTSAGIEIAHGRETNVGFTYCALTQSAYQWLGDWLAVRRKALSADHQISPVDRLNREKASRALSELFLVWAESAKLDEKDKARFFEIREQVMASVALTPPRELPGCEQCPVRCQMLPFVIPHLAIVQKTVASPLLASQPANASLSSIERNTAAIQQSIPLLTNRGSEDPVRRQWLYCMLTNIDPPPAAETKRGEVLALLRQPAAPSHAGELNDIFGVSDSSSQ
jgi:DNA helicase HerA-like ATPase